MTDATETKTPAPFVRTVTEKGWTSEQYMLRLDTLGITTAGSRVITRIDAARAMRQSVVAGAGDIVSQDIGKAKMRLVRESQDAVDILDPGEHPLARRLALRPSRYQTWVRFWMQTISTLLVRQEVVVYKRRSSRSDVAPELIPLQHGEWEQSAADGRFFYSISASTEGRVAMLGLASGLVSADDVIHFVARSENGYDGLSTLTIGSDVLGLNAMVVDFQASLVKGGTRPMAAIQVPELMDDEAFKRLKAQVTAALADAAAKGEPFVLEQGAEFKNIGLDASQTDLVNARNQLAREVARLFRMPPHKLGMTEDLNRANLEAMEKAYVDDTLVPYCEVVEQELSGALLTEEERLSGLRFQFDREELYDRDPQARRERIEMQFKTGITFLNEARRKLSLPPVEANQDHRSVPVNTAQVFRDGRVQIFTSQPSRDGANDTAPADPAASGQTRGLRLVSDNS